MNQRYFISGIGTDVGKTFVSAVLAEALQADYWKPVQCGTEGGSDRERVMSLVTNPKSVFHPEAYVFDEPVSPHMAAANANVRIIMEHIALPETNNKLLIEGAGGLMVPLTENNYVIDLAHQLDSEVILVCSSYLGCINHSLLSIDYLLKNDIPVKGLVFNGNFDKAVKAAIMGFAELPVIAELPRIAELTKESVGQMAKLVNRSLFEEIVE